MMKRVILLRHAKAQRSTGEPDHDRPLAPAGVEAAGQAARSIVAARWNPDIAIVSDASRTRQTFEAMRALLPAELEVRLDPGLYDATPAAILALIRETPDDRACLLVIGHNPGIGEVAHRLALKGAAGDLARLAGGFPTAAIAALTFQASRWRDIGHTGSLEAYLLVDPSGGAD